MLIRLTYATKERNYISPHVYQNVTSPEVEISPIAIRRRSVGSRGKALERYHYSADFKAPTDAEFAINEKITSTINRKKNPHFKPSKIMWIGDSAVMIGLSNGA